MNMTTSIQSLYAYTQWANQRVLEVCERLTPEQFHAEVGSSFRSIQATLVHTMNVQASWTRRFQSKPRWERLPPETLPALVDVRTAWKSVDALTEMFVATLHDDMLAQNVTYTNDAGEAYTYALWQMLLHQANHAQQHRSEVAHMLTGFGHSPGNLDYLVYLNERWG